MKATLAGKRYSITRCQACDGTGILALTRNAFSERGHRVTCPRCGGKGSIVSTKKPLDHAR